MAAPAATNTAAEAASQVFFQLRGRGAGAATSSASRSSTDARSAGGALKAVGCIDDTDGGRERITTVGGGLGTSWANAEEIGSDARSLNGRATAYSCRARVRQCSTNE